MSPRKKQEVPRHTRWMEIAIGVTVMTVMVAVIYTLLEINISIRLQNEWLERKYQTIFEKQNQKKVEILRDNEITMENCLEAFPRLTLPPLEEGEEATE